MPILNGLRTLGNNTPILNSWAGDGNYWYTPEPEGHELLLRHVRVGVRQRSGARRSTRSRKKNAAAIAKAGSTGAFVTGPAAIDGILVALKRDGRLDERRRARRADGEVQERPDALGARELLEDLHTVYGRQYRVIQVQNNIPKVVGTIKAKVVPKI